MSNPLKKQRAVFPIEEYVPEESDEEVDDMIGQIINVEFEGFRANDGDFHGIKRLLQQSFRDLDVNLSGLADIIISQNYVGSVIKQVTDEDDEDDDDDTTMETEEDAADQVFGVTTIVNLTSRKEDPTISGLRTALVEKCATHATDATNQMVRELLGHESKHVGLLISERLVNLPPQFAIPVFDILREELKEANSKDMPYNFTHLVMICKLYKLKGNKKKSKGIPLEPITWSNPEEEIFAQESITSFEFEIKGDTALTGEWEEDDAQYTPWRKVLLMNAAKLPEIVAKVKAAVSQDGS